MAINKDFNPEFVVLPAASTYESGDPIRSNGLNGVCLEDSGNVTTGYATVNTEGVWDLSVQAVDDEGSTTIAAGDTIYFDSANTPSLSKRSSGSAYGIAQEAISYGLTDTIQVFLIQDADEAEAGKTGTLCYFKTGPVTSGKGGGAATGTGGDENNMIIDGINFEYHIVGTATATAPIIVAGGLDIGLDDADDDGIEITRGITARSPEAFTVGTSPAFYMKVEATLADVSGTDAFLMGFRKLEAYQADPDDYDEAFAANVNAGNIIVTEILNGAATATTDTTDDWADGETHVIEVRVSAAGVCTLLIDGAAPTATSAFTFDDGEVVIPFVYFRHDSDVAEDTTLSRWEVDYQ